MHRTVMLMAFFLMNGVLLAADFKMRGIVLAVGSSDGSVRIFEEGGPADALERWLVRLDRLPSGATRTKTIMVVYIHSDALIDPNELGRGSWLFTLRAPSSGEEKRCLGSPRRKFQWMAVGSHALSKPSDSLPCFFMEQRPKR